MTKSICEVVNELTRQEQLRLQAKLQRACVRRFGAAMSYSFRDRGDNTWRCTDDESGHFIEGYLEGGDRLYVSKVHAGFL